MRERQHEARGARESDTWEENDGYVFKRLKDRDMWDLDMVVGPCMLTHIGSIDHGLVFLTK